MTNDTHEARRSEIRAAMLARAAARRRTRRLAQASLTVACMLAVLGTGWITLRPPTRSTPPVAPEVATADDHAAPSHKIVPAGMSSVLDRAISDDELLDLLREAGEQAGLGIIDGQAELVRWHAEPEEKPSEPGASGARPDEAILASS